jgi:UDP-N-acetylglucosamine 2-epimerase (non-hydrolysing)
MKLDPVMRALSDLEMKPEQYLVHTGQHYDDRMSKVFFEDLDLPEPDVNLEVGSGSHAAQTAKLLWALEGVLSDWRPDWVFVYGDANSTLAAALVATKMDLRVAHVEAGLRSLDRTMPEEINRIVVDSVSDLLFTPSKDGDENLLREGVSAAKIRFVGNVMIDTLVRNLDKTDCHPILGELGLVDDSESATAIQRYIVATLHRPANVDDPDVLKGVVKVLGKAGRRFPIIFPVHPRTQKLLKQHSIDLDPSIRVIEPQGYLAFLSLIRHAALVVADSGGVQEETTFLGVPCLTVRPNTERPVTIEHGTNRLVDSAPQTLLQEIDAALGCVPPPARRPPDLWDGHAGVRIASVMRSLG